MELQKNPAKDPITLLEEYQEKGAATMPIAVLCLEHFTESLTNVPKERRRAAVSETEAGRRVLLWLWKNKLHETDAFVNDQRLMRIMVLLVIEEGFEETLWEWFQLDMELGPQVNSLPDRSSKPARLKRVTKEKRQRFRWKGRLLGCMMDAKLSVMDPNEDADRVIKDLLRARRIKQAAAENQSDTFFPLGNAGTVISKGLFGSDKLRNSTSSEVYDAFIEAMDSTSDGTGILQEMERARLVMFHPHHPSPQPLLSGFRRIFVPDRSSDARTFFWHITPATNDRDLVGSRARNEEVRTGFWFFLILQCAAKLYEANQTTDADWLVSQARAAYPNKARFVEEDLQRFASSRNVKKAPVAGDIDTPSLKPQRIPMPALG